MKSSKKTGTSSSNKINDNGSINPMENPKEAIDFYMPLPDEVYKKMKKK